MDEWKKKKRKKWSLHLQGRVSHSRHLQWLTETLHFLLMVYSRLYISLHIFQMFCVGCWKLPGLIQCSLCHRQQGAGPLLCMTEWNEAAEPRRGVNTTHCTSTTPHSRLQTPSPFTFPPADPMQHKVWHAASIGVQWERGSERRGRQQLTSTRAVPSSLLTLSSRVTAGARCSCSVYSWGEGGDLILYNTVIVLLPSHWHQ